MSNRVILVNEVRACKGMFYNMFSVKLVPECQTIWIAYKAPYYAGVWSQSILFANVILDRHFFNKRRKISSVFLQNFWWACCPCKRKCSVVLNFDWLCFLSKIRANRLCIYIRFLYIFYILWVIKLWMKKKKICILLFSEYMCFQ